ncbi:MAG: AhpC/TSA family protein [Candidatus Riflebacteria bacterium]|nr:AhpC/TSA family protein [Candidatus Riflebacteria bacterium]
MRAASGRKASPEKRAIVETALRDLTRSGLLEHSLKPGARAPDFTLPNSEGKSVQLRELLARGPVVLVFYRGHWCPYCNAQLAALQEALPRLREAGASLVAISPEKPDYVKESVQTMKLEFEVLSDAGNRVARSFGLAFRVPPKLEELYRGFGLTLEKFNADGKWELPVPGTFVLDRQGLVALASVDPDYTRRLEPEAILAALAKLRLPAKVPAGR